MPFGRQSTEPVDVLIVDADPAQRRSLAGLISERALGKFSAHGCATTAEALALRRDWSGSIVIADLETIGGTDRLGDLLAPSAPLIATSASGSLNTAVAAVRAGAVDFMAKPIGAKALIEHLEAAVSHWQPATTPPSAPTKNTTRTPLTLDFAGFIGSSPAMEEVYRQIRRVAPSRAPVFITGESGTGKEVCAEAVHMAAGGDGRPFIAINCSAIPRDLMESEIFGHVRGAFTGASETRTGAAELADGGTLFLDEIGEMDLALQAKLLRLIQTGAVRPVGGSETRRVDVRFVCATNRDPQVEIEAGRFRADLYYRLHVLPIHLPPLRERREDILPLADAFLARYSAEEGRAFKRFTGEAAAWLSAWDWPGNVRELQNLIRRTVVLHEGETVTAGMLPAPLSARPAGTGAAPLPGPAGADAGVEPFWQQERRIIEQAVAAFGGNIGRAAAALDISASTIYRKRLAWAERAAGA